MEYDNNVMLVCRTCGYKIKAANLKSVCPACGVDKKFFEPYTDKIAAKRRLLLELHLHPIVVHFSVGISIFIFLVIFVSLFTGGKISSALNSSAIVMSVALPFFVTAGLLSGIFDGILRFKKIKRPMLLTKIYLSACFLIVSIAMLVIALVYRIDTSSTKIIMLLLSIFSAGFGTALGRLGGYLTEAIMPGK